MKRSYLRGKIRMYTFVWYKSKDHENPESLYTVVMPFPTGIYGWFVRLMDRT